MFLIFIHPIAANFLFSIFKFLSLNSQLHGTHRRKDRVYSENIFNGKGKALNEVTPEELAQDLAERKSENPYAYRSNSNENALSEQELKFK